MSEGTYLFIGGSHDGRRLNVPPQDTLVVLPAMISPLEHYELTRDKPRQIERYRQERLRIYRSEYIYYVHENMPSEIAFELLLENYRGKFRP